MLSYDEKPGIQAIGNTAPDLPPVPGRHRTVGRDHEYKRHGTLSLLAGIDLLSGEVLGLVRDRHRSAEFVEFLAVFTYLLRADFENRECSPCGQLYPAISRFKATADQPILPALPPFLN